MWLMRPPCLVAFLCSVFLSAVQPPHLTIPSPLSEDPVSELSATCRFNLSELPFMHSSCPLYALCSALPQVPVIVNVTPTLVMSLTSPWPVRPSVCLSVHSRDGEPPLRPSSTGHSWARETGRRRLQEPRPLRLCLGTRDGVVVSTFYETDVVRPSSSYPQASPESLQGAVQTQPYPPRPRARVPDSPPGAGG
ncbi:hypothetical protein CCUS01_02873 [Colletotrichum cuscutae]|uniref:Uncharacterized protein n=1 Tax=Colletotrichum cuscutae TaxID=1209917 RepID=A0AAI9YAL8_9PEZI|nr:hypothetical protein CCUS01_02873 [Colletotrichum cuscutae]